MTWLRIDDQMADHPKIRSVGPLGFALQIAAITYCSRHLTDGFMSFSVCSSIVRAMFAERTDAEGRIWTPAETCGHSGRDASEVDWQTVMVDARLWDVVDGGYKVHDYDQYNPSKAAVLAQRDKAKDRASKARGTKEAREKFSQTSVELLDEFEGSSPYPNPLPNPFKISDPPIGPPLDSSPDSGSASEPSKPKPASRRKPQTALPEFCDADAMSQWLERWKLQLGPELSKFIEWHRSKGSTFADWSAAWRTWQRNSKRFESTSARGTAHYRLGVQPSAEEFGDGGYEPSAGPVHSSEGS